MEYLHDGVSVPIDFSAFIIFSSSSSSSSSSSIKGIVCRRSGKVTDEVARGRLCDTVGRLKSEVTIAKGGSGGTGRFELIGGLGGTGGLGGSGGGGGVLTGGLLFLLINDVCTTICSSCVKLDRMMESNLSYSVGVDTIAAKGYH